jgi:putative phage-type endonuclease
MKHTITNESHWHELRAKHIGGSEVAALFGRSPYSTPWQMWMQKAGKLERPFDETYTRAGKFFEAGIAAWAAEKWGMNIHKVEEYYTDDDCPGLGATLDYATDDGIPVEIKFNHWKSADWKYDGETLTEVPESYIWQVQHQLACYGGDYGWLVAFIDGEPRRMKVRRSDRIIHNIRKAVTEFWASIAADEPPPVDYTSDGEALADLLFFNRVHDVRLDGYEEQFKKYLEWQALLKEGDGIVKALKAELLEAAEQAMHGINDRGPKAVVRCGSYKMSLTLVDDNPGKMVTPDMVGTHVGGRKGYLLPRVSEEKPK